MQCPQAFLLLILHPISVQCLYQACDAFGVSRCVYQACDDEHVWIVYHAVNIEDQKCMHAQGRDDTAPVVTCKS